MNKYLIKTRNKNLIGWNPFPWIDGKVVDQQTTPILNKYSVSEFDNLLALKSFFNISDYDFNYV